MQNNKMMLLWVSVEAVKHRHTNRIKTQNRIIKYPSGMLHTDGFNLQLVSLLCVNIFYAEYVACFK